MARKSKLIEAEVMMLDNGIGITIAGELVRRDGSDFEPIYNPSAADITRDGAAGTQLTAYGRIEFFMTPGKNVIARMTFENEKPKRVQWVPITGKKNTKPRREKVETSHRRGETLFNPREHMAR